MGGNRFVDVIDSHYIPADKNGEAGVDEVDLVYTQNMSGSCSPPGPRRRVFLESAAALIRVLRKERRLARLVMAFARTRAIG
jgi:hypothetical protein